ncbi:MAG: signal peptidase I [Planctomycetaceae bacterium]|nr:signal peptidase I [Planctomycetaceae bacterium]
MSDGNTSRRVPWVAMSLSFLSAGIGHIYCGRIYKGLLLYFSWFVIPLSCFIAAFVEPSAGVLIGFVLLPVTLVMIIYLYAAFDAYEIAKRGGSDYELKDYNRAILYWLLIFVWLAYPISLIAGVREFVYEAFYLPTRSMNPSVVQGDRILVNKLWVQKQFPERGDVVVFRNPEPTGGRVFIERVVAVAGDRIVIKGDEVEINGKRLERNRIPLESLDGIRDQIDGDPFYESNSGKRYKVMYGDGPAAEIETDPIDIVVPPRNVFLLGDNRDRSRDSRHFGPIHAGDIIGHVDYIFYPTGNWSRFGVYRD